MRTFEIKVSPERAVDGILVRVVDGRPDKQLYMNSITFTGQTYLYPLAPDPPLAEALRGFIQLAARSHGFSRSNGDPLITVEAIDIKNRVGFALPDDMSCQMESTLRIGVAAQGTEHRVRSFARSQQNLSALVQTSAEVIVKECLAQHANEVLNVLAAASGG